MKHTVKTSDCMFMVPHEITGIGAVCALFKGVCNKLGARCIGYEKHTAKSFKALEKALAECRARKEAK